MEQIASLARTFGPLRLAIIGGVLVALLAFFGWLLSRTTESDFALLYGDLEMADAARVVAELESAGIPYELRGDGTAIYVPADQVPRTRVRLADGGLPSGGSLGYELFDGASSLGTTDFMQNVTLVRALEGELARTIRSIDGVQAARVHLVLPRRELFQRDRQEPSASVVLTMRGKRRLGESQIQAVRNLVASAVPGLLPTRISLVDQQGTLLAGAFEDGIDGAGGRTRAEEMRLGLENRLARTIEDLLARTVGPEKARAEVSADMDFDRINTSEEIFDPEGQVVRSTQSIEEGSHSKEGTSDLPVTVGTNLPDAEAAAGDGVTANNSEARTEETVNYEISKKVINHVRESGIVKRLSVAVLVDGTYAPGADGGSTYQPRSQEELNLLATLVRSAIGYDAARGDTVEVINMPFVAPAAGAEPPSDDLFGFASKDLLDLAEYLVLVIFALLVVLLVVRPLLGRVMEALPAPAREAAGSAPDLLGNGSVPALAAPGDGATALLPSGSAFSPAAADEGMIDIDRVEGRVRASTVRKVGEIISNHPEESVAILRSWLHEGR